MHDFVKNVFKVSMKSMGNQVASVRLKSSDEHDCEDQLDECEQAKCKKLKKTEKEDTNV